MASPIRITRLPDRQLVKLANSVFEILPIARLEVQFNGGGSASSDEKFDLRNFSTKTFSIQKITIFTLEERRWVDICRGSFSGAEVIDRNKFATVRLSSPFDEYMLFSQKANFTPEEAVEIDKVFASHRADLVGEGGATSDLNAIVSTQLEQLRQLAVEFSERQVEAETRLEKSFRKREDALEKRIQAEEGRLTAQRVDEEGKLASEKAKINAWRDEINDREPQHERRRLRETLTGELRSVVGSKPSPSSNREWIVNSGYLVVGLGFVLTSVFLTLGIDGPAPQSAGFWAIIIKSILAGLGGAAFIWAGLSGLKGAAKSGREYEQQIQRYSFDMDRASWVVETILQMNSTESAQVPDEWLASVCRDLFATTNERPEEGRSLDALAALLDATARAKIGTSGVDFEFDRKAAKQLTKDRS
ncbi:MAG: hypothetical protein JKX86_05930 [Verrucomicrobiales bacterium]|nr:hypothetical protein [Verrucomicrobiales bacterium]